VREPPDRAHRQSQPRPAGSEALRVSRTRRRGASGALRRRQRLICAPSPATTSARKTSARGRPRCAAPSSWPPCTPKACRSEGGRRRGRQRVAEKLGNTPAVCRKAYIHPGVIAEFLATARSRCEKAARRSDAHCPRPPRARGHRSHRADHGPRARAVGPPARALRPVRACAGKRAKG